MKAWEANIRKVEPYVAGEQPKYKDMIKLNTNENPYPPSPCVQTLMESLNMDDLRLYPDTSAAPLREKLAAFYHLNPEQIFVGVGSDDVLAMCFLTFFHSKRPILFPDITYSFYDVWAKLYQIPYECQPLDDDFRIRKEDYYKPNGGVVIANPNAPTSIYEDLSMIEDILKNNQDSIVIVDEAYIDFGGTSAITLLDQYENLVVVQTYSKSRSMAGMRIGYAMAGKELIQALNDVKCSVNSYTMNQTAILLGTEALKDKDYFYQTINKIVKTREETKEELRSLGFCCPDSKTNFLFITHPKLSGEEIFLYLREHHIFVRYFKKPRISEYLRVTIGTKEQMNLLIEQLKVYCRQKDCL